jgi:hypothetical protein
MQLLPAELLQADIPSNKSDKERPAECAVQLEVDPSKDRERPL